MGKSMVNHQWFQTKPYVTWKPRRLTSHFTVQSVRAYAHTKQGLQQRGLVIRVIVCPQASPAWKPKDGLQRLLHKEHGHSEIADENFRHANPIKLLQSQPFKVAEKSSQFDSCWFHSLAKNPSSWGATNNNNQHILLSTNNPLLICYNNNVGYQWLLTNNNGYYNYNISSNVRELIINNPHYALYDAIIKINK